jgi:hypothetical protein
MTFPNRNPLVLGSLILLGVSALTLIAVLLPSLVFVEGQTSELQIDASRFSSPRPHTELLTDYTVVASQSLFNKGRLSDPLPLAQGPAKPALPSADTYRLVGLILSPELRIALVERTASGDVLHLHPGDAVDGWTVRSVEAAGVTLAAQNATAELKIPKAASRKADAGATTSVTAAAAVAATTAMPSAATLTQAGPMGPTLMTIGRSHK